MKLKKIVSLALAGVLTVSMLAGCGDNGTSNSGSSSSEQTTSTGVVAGVEGGIKSWNSDLEISVESSTNMDSAIEKLFDKYADVKVDEDVIRTQLNIVFNVPTTEMRYDSDFVKYAVADYLIKGDKHNDGDTLYAYTIIPVKKANGDANVYAGNVIGEALQDLKNTIALTSTTNTDDDSLDVKYTMYVCSEEALMADNSVGTYVIAVLKTDYTLNLG